MRWWVSCLAWSFAALALPATAAQPCDTQLQNQILHTYVESFHPLWGEGSEREKVESVLDAFAGEVAPVLVSHQSSNCRFSEIVERSLPRQPLFGPKLSPDAKAIGVIFEFDASRSQFCVGLNDDRKLGTPIDDRFPYQRRPMEEPWEKVAYTHYAMKCYDADGNPAGYQYLTLE
jgi:hypothetical protein